MDLRPYHSRDLDRLIALTIDTFGSFYERSFRGIVGDAIFVHQHGTWREDYRQQVPKLHDPENNEYVAVVEDAGAIVGYVAWNIDPDKHHGVIDVLAVASTHRRYGIGTALSEHAFTHMKQAGVEVVTIGTGGDGFHAPARALYERLGCTLFPAAVYYKQL